ncbi:MAG: VanZ family protein [Candidatus Aminicenantes bacterium]|nr:VanZ family protein [Candidatus Aminicenantes bacterium]
MKLNRFVKYWLPPILWMIFFFPVLNRFLGSPAIYRALLSVVGIFIQDIRASSIEVPYIIIRKSIHFIEYAVLTVLLFRAFKGDSPEKWGTRWAVYSGVIAISYGFLDEFLQTFVPTRNGSILDSVIDSAGVLFALGMIGIKAQKQDSDEN